jgi:hypothetical protein
MSRENEINIEELYEELKYCSLLKVRIINYSIYNTASLHDYVENVLSEDRVWFNYDDNGNENVDCLLTKEEYEKLPTYYSGLYTHIIDYENLKFYKWPLKYYYN